MTGHVVRNVNIKEMSTEIQPPFAKPCSYVFCTMCRMRLVWLKSHDGHVSSRGAQQARFEPTPLTAAHTFSCI